MKCSHLGIYKFIWLFLIKHWMSSFKIMNIWLWRQTMNGDTQGSCSRNKYEHTLWMVTPTIGLPKWLWTHIMNGDTFYRSSQMIMNTHDNNCVWTGMSMFWLHNDHTSHFNNGSDNSLLCNLQAQDYGRGVSYPIL